MMEACTIWGLTYIDIDSEIILCHPSDFKRLQDDVFATLSPICTLFQTGTKLQNVHRAFLVQIKLFLGDFSILYSRINLIELIRERVSCQRPHGGTNLDGVSNASSKDRTVSFGLLRLQVPMNEVKTSYQQDDSQHDESGNDSTLDVCGRLLVGGYAATGVVLTPLFLRETQPEQTNISNWRNTLIDGDVVAFVVSKDALLKLCACSNACV
mmetsp:Transcript_13439/g.22878  ORF Transcript_13439/g.22878 Transcript_13439/m.22878 type:complete len:211 (+) Transcript_13439:289-921(+)